MKLTDGDCYQLVYFVHQYLQGGPKNDPTCFLSELRQIFTKFANFWHTDSQDNRLMGGTLIVHLSDLTLFRSDRPSLCCTCV